jgi:hypothetical protein
MPEPAMTTPTDQAPAEPAQPATPAQDQAPAEPPAQDQAPPPDPEPVRAEAQTPLERAVASSRAVAAVKALTGELRVRPEIRERALMLWIVTGLGGLCGWIVFAFFWKLPGQDQDRWFGTQLLQALVVGAIGWLGYPLWGLGFVAHLALGLVAFAAIAKNHDFVLPIVGGAIRRR